MRPATVAPADLKHERELAQQLKQEKLEAERNAYQLGREKVEAQKAIQQIAQEREEAQEEARRLREAAQKEVRRLRKELAAERIKGFFRRLFRR